MVKTGYSVTEPHPRWTLQCDVIRNWVEKRLEGRVLNACCGKSKLSHGDEVVRNDINEKREADLHVDVAELSIYFDENSFDTIFFDPPWSIYQSNLRYEGNHVRATADGISSRINIEELPLDIDESKEQVGHASLTKRGFDYLLKPGGRVIQLSFSGTCMPSHLDYEQKERYMFDPVGEGRTMIASVDMKGGRSKLIPDEKRALEW